MIIYSRNITKQCRYNSNGTTCCAWSWGAYARLSREGVPQGMPHIMPRGIPPAHVLGVCANLNTGNDPSWRMGQSLAVAQQLSVAQSPQHKTSSYQEVVEAIKKSMQADPTTIHVRKKKEKAKDL